MKIYNCDEESNKDYEYENVNSSTRAVDLLETR